MFPFVFRIGEWEDTPMRAVVLEALAANMLMLLWYDFCSCRIPPSRSRDRYDDGH